MSKVEQPTVINYDFAADYATALTDPALIILHEDFKIVDIQHFLPNARRIKGTFQSTDAQSYFDYVTSRQAEVQNGSEQSRTYVNATAPEKFLQAVTVLNFGTSKGADTAGHGDDRAELSLSKDPLFELFLKVAESRYSPLKLAEAIEPLLGAIVLDAKHTDIQTGVEESMSITQAVSALRNFKYETKQVNETNVGQFAGTVSDMESFEMQGTGGLKLPTHIMVTTPLYLGLENQVVVYKIKLEEVEHEGKKKPVLSLVPLNLNVAYIRAGVSFQSFVKTNLPNEKVSIGCYSK